MNKEINMERKNAPIRLMAHLVAGYPSHADALIAAKALVDGGITYVEIQFPFSDPSADGKAIQSACSSSLQQGWSLKDGFSFVHELHSLYPEIPIFIMTYANLAYKTGIELFVEKASESGASGLIIPDLPFDSDEGLHEACLKKGLVSIPVAAPSMTKERISLLLSMNRPMIYAALRAGITGYATVIDDATRLFISSLSFSGASILGGFGIRNGKTSKELAPFVHTVIAGSIFVDCISDNYKLGEKQLAFAVTEKTRELTGK